MSVMYCPVCFEELMKHYKFEELYFHTGLVHTWEELCTLESNRDNSIESLKCSQLIFTKKMYIKFAELLSLRIEERERDKIK